jgi:tetratricopeptide (TPR) repeat protein
MGQALAEPVYSAVMHLMRAVPKFRAAFLVLAVVPSLTTGCAGQERRFDSVDYLRQEYAKHTDRLAAADILVPFELDDEIETFLDTKLKPAPRESYRVEQINDLIFRKLQLQYALRPTRNAVDTYHAREGNCLSFVNLFVGIARHNRLSPFYVEVVDHQRWRHQNGMILSQGHIVAGMYVAGLLKTFDFLPYTPKSYKNFKPIDDLTATAHHYNNLAGEALLEGDTETAEHYLAIATDLVPTFEKALNNLGVLLARKGEREAALEVYRKGLASDPANVPILTNMARIYQQMGRLEEAEAALARVEGAKVTNPFYFVYRGELALSADDAARALEYLRDALRIDTEIPETHVGLVKAYVALGDLQKARHHLERALRLDATHLEARNLARMLAGS